MKTIQMTIDEVLLERVDETVHALNTTRSAFIRDALEHALASHYVRSLEKQDAAGYAHIPADSTDAVDWESEQAWGDKWE